MPTSQDILQISFDTAASEKSKNIQIAHLKEVLALAEKINGIKINIGSNATGLQATIDNQSKLTKVTDDYNKTIAENTKQQILAEKLRQQQLKTLKAEEDQVKRNTKAKKDDAAVLEADSSKILTQSQLAERKRLADEDAALSGRSASTSSIDTGTFTNLKNQTSAYKENTAAKIENKKSAEQLRREEELDNKIKQENKILAQQQVSALKNQIKEENSVKGSLEQRRLALARLTLAYDKLSAAERDTGYGKRLQTTVMQVGEQVKTLEATTNRFRTNVGNYPKTFDVATSSIDKMGKAASKAFGFIKTAANIIPGLGISGIFLLAYEAIVKVVEGMDLFGKKAGAISDEMKKLKDDSTEFEKSLGQVKAGAIETGVKLQSFVDIARDGKLPLAERNMALAEANKILGEHGEKLTIANINTQAATDAVKKYTDALVAEALAAKYANRIADLIVFRTDALDRYNTKMKESEVIEKEVGGLQGNNSRDLIDQYNSLITKRNEARENLDQYNFLNGEVTKITARLNDEQRKSLGLFTELGTKTKESKKDVKDYGDVLNGLAEELRVLGEELASQLISDDAFDTGKIQAYEKAIKSLFSLGAAEDTPLVQQLLGKLDPLKLEKDLKEAIKNLKNAALQNKDELSFPIGLKYDKTDEQKAYADALEGRQRFEATANAQDQLNLLKRYRSGKIGKEQYEKELLSIQETYAQKSIQNQIDSLENEKEFAFRGVEQTQEVANKKADIEKRLAELRLLLAKKTADNEDKTNKERLAKLSEFIQDAQSATNQVADLIGGVIDIGITKQKNALQELEDTRQKNYEMEVARINNSTLSQTAQAEALKKLEATRFAEKQQFERKLREEDLKRARFNKAQNIANIAMEGALAVVHQLGSGDPATSIFRAIAVGALSAAKLAIAIATPLPKFATGVKNKATDGWGIFGEAGAELVEIPGQNPFIADKATAGFLPRGTNITPLSGNEVNDILYRAMAKQTAGAIMGNHKQDDKSVSLLMNIEHGINKLTKKNTNVRVNINHSTEWAAYKNSYYRRP